MNNLLKHPNPHVIISGLATLLLTPLSANWTLIEDYEDGQHPSGYGEINTNPDGIGDGGQFIQADPLAPDNQVALIIADTGEVNFSNFHLGWFPLERPINDGEIVTYYMRHMKEGFFHDVVWGFTSEAPPSPPLFYPFSAHHVNMQYSVLDGGFFGVNNQSGEIFFPETEVWYEVWTVIDHAADNFEIYVKGGEFADITSVHAGDFRNGALSDSLTWFVTWSITGSATNPRGTDPLYFDDVYIDYTGINLTTPEPGGDPDGNAWYDVGTNAGGLGEVLAVEDQFVQFSGLGWVFIFPGTGGRLSADGGFIAYRYSTGTWVWTAEDYGGWFFDYTTGWSSI